MNTGFKHIDGEEIKPITTSKLNNFKVKPLINSDRPIENIGGGTLIPEVYANIFLLSKKKTGKTTLLYNLLKACCNKKTNVVIFSSTINRDKTWEDILKMLDKKKCNVQKFVDIEDDENGEILADIIDELKYASEDENKDKIGTPKDPCAPSIPKINFGFRDEVKEKAKEDKKKEKEKEREEKAEKKKKLYPEFIFVFDDMGDTLRAKIISQLLKTNRHYRSKVIISSHHLTDITPPSRKQIDYLICGHSMNLDKLKDIYQDLDISCPFEDFKRLYEYATSEPYHFLFVDVKNNLFRKDFNEHIEI